MKYFDAHTHANFVAYDEDREGVLQRARDSGVGMNVVGTMYDTSKSAVALAEKHDDIYATIGLHPIHTGKSHHDENELGAGNKAFTSRGEVFDPSAYAKLGASKKVIAIGECGLDYYRLDEESKKVQIDAFLQQIELARALSKPLMLHVRSSQGTQNAYEDVLDILESHPRARGDVHFFAGSVDIAKRFLYYRLYAFLHWGADIYARLR